MQAYSDPSRESDPHALPDLEIFWAGADEIELPEGNENDDGGRFYPEGFYYWFCFPGCMPDSEATGPFDSEDAALADAREGCDY